VDLRVICGGELGHCIVTCRAYFCVREHSVLDELWTFEEIGGQFGIVHQRSSRIGWRLR
jgi:hypothetical protein